MHTHGRGATAAPFSSAPNPAQASSPVIEAPTHLVDGDPILVVHLVELVDEADALVGQHQCAALQHPPVQGIRV